MLSDEDDERQIFVGMESFLSYLVIPIVDFSFAFSFTEGASFFTEESFIMAYGFIITGILSDLPPEELLF